MSYPHEVIQNSSKEIKSYQFYQIIYLPIFHLNFFFLPSGV